MDRDRSSKPHSRRRATGADGRPQPATDAVAAGNSPSLAPAGPDVAAAAPRTAGGAPPPSSTHAAGWSWPGASLGGSFREPSSTSSEWLYPSGGFMNYLQSANFSPFAQPHPFENYQNGMHPSENFHFVGAPMGQNTPSPTAACSKRTPPTSGSSAEDAPKVSQEKETIDVDDDGTLHARSDKRLNWSNEEDIRLVSAWLHNLIDSVDGNDRKADQYWADVTATYNSSTKTNRMRNRNQLKLRWERIKKPVNDFNGCHARVTKVHQSGMSDDQQMDKALELYASEHGGKPFTMVHIWKILRHERKWSAYVKRNSQEKDNSVTLNPAHVVNVDDNPKQRPMGHKQAKDIRNGKRKAPEATSAVDEKLNKVIEVCTMAKEEREKMAEVQQSLANKKLEAAKEKTKCKLLGVYKDLSLAPTSGLNQEALAERTKTLQELRLVLFPKND